MAKTNMTPSFMEPMLPSSSNRALEDLAIAIIEGSASMATQINPIVQRSIGDLVRNMNCYYSNLIEGHNTHPRDIERALAADYSKNKEQRDLQLEAKAHIEVQAMIDNGHLVKNAFSVESIQLIHREFYRRLPESLCFVINTDTHEKIAVRSGEFRLGDVIVGQHVAPQADLISKFLVRFENAYDFSKLSRIQQIIAIAAAHHRLLWIHPFYDGNGRVTRLVSHAAFKQAGVGNSLWSISRGLARNSQEYKNNLLLADSLRQGDLDGRGNLSEKYLVNFCEFFLETAADQIQFMHKLLNVSELMSRIEMYAWNEVNNKRLPKGSVAVLKEALVKGRVTRKEIPTLTGYAERQSRTIVASLLKEKLLTSDSAYGDLYLGFPQHIVAEYFPKLYPAI